MEKTFEIDLIVQKKNRKYFAAVNKNGFSVKILIDEASEALECSETVQTLRVIDMSLRSKYGVDVIYRLASDILVDAWKKPVLLKADYNLYLVEKCRQLGGKWDSQEKLWAFSSLVANEVEELDYLFNGPMAAIEIKAKSDRVGSQDAVRFIGYKICEATGRDSGAQLAPGVSCISGDFDSSGSMKNWVTKVNEGSVFRLHVSKPWLDLMREQIENWDITEL